MLSLRLVLVFESISHCPLHLADLTWPIRTCCKFLAMDKEEEVVHVQGLPCRTWQGEAGGGEVEQGGERRRPASCSDALGDLSMGRLLVIHPEDVLCSRLHPIHTLEHHQALPSHINTSTAPKHQQSRGAPFSLDTRPHQRPHQRPLLT